VLDLRVAVPTQEVALRGFVSNARFRLGGHLRQAERLCGGISVMKVHRRSGAVVSAPLTCSASLVYERSLETLFSLEDCRRVAGAAPVASPGGLPDKRGNAVLWADERDHSSGESDLCLGVLLRGSHTSYAKVWREIRALSR
jgi:hypothetical protein